MELAPSPNCVWTHIGHCFSKKCVVKSKLLTSHVLILGLVLSMFILCYILFSVFHHFYFGSTLSVNLSKGFQRYDDEDASEKRLRTTYERLLTFSWKKSQIHNQYGSSALWDEPYKRALFWRPCASKHKEISKDDVTLGTSANAKWFYTGQCKRWIEPTTSCGVQCGCRGLSTQCNACSSKVSLQQRVERCEESSQFGDIYQEDDFIDILKDDLNIVRGLPDHFQTLDIEAIGSQVTDAHLGKESKPTQLIEKVLPLLLKNGVVHFLGFGNRLGFDPVPPNLQKLRCKCNFHALKFTPRIQETGSLLVQRIRKHKSRTSELDTQLLGDYIPSNHLEDITSSYHPYKYLALHLRFEVDMLAYSLCSFGGGERERKELQAYRETHFPFLIQRMEKSTSISPEDLRKSGKCPLTPEEAAIMLSAAGFDSETYIYLAGSRIYGGKSRLTPLMRIFPNLVTKEDLLTEEELASFKNFSSRMAALDFIACAVADVFAMTDSGSQLSSLVSGLRVYHGRGHAPILRPNKKLLAELFSQNSSSVTWSSFSDQVKNMFNNSQRPCIRHKGKSIYRDPRSPGCMCMLKIGDI